MKTTEQQAADYADSIPSFVKQPDIEAAYLAGYNAAGNKWVDVATPPETNSTVLVKANGGYRFIMYYGLGGGNPSYPELKDYWFYDDDIVRPYMLPTEWMPMP